MENVSGKRNPHRTNNFSEHVYLFHDGCPYHTETSPLICSVWYDMNLRHEGAKWIFL